MIEKIKNNIKLFQFNHLSKFDDIIHFSSTRVGGVSSNHLASLNLGYTVNDNPDHVSKNLEMLASVINMDKKQMVSPKQINAYNIGIVKSENDLFPDTDALITNVQNICIFVRTADCVPILLYDPFKKVVAAIHSGWKGTVNEISKTTIETMKKEFGTNPKDIIAGIGPSIGPEVYEVGPEVVVAFQELFGINHVITSIENSEKGYLNLWEANKQVLMNAGVLENQIEISGMCTFSNPKLFYSARRDKAKTGRLASGIMIK